MFTALYSLSEADSLEMLLLVPGDKDQMTINELLVKSGLAASDVIDMDDSKTEFDGITV